MTNSGRKSPDFSWFYKLADGAGEWVTTIRDNYEPEPRVSPRDEPRGAMMANTIL
jgi:hypothetical protein